MKKRLMSRRNKLLEEFFDREDEETHSGVSDPSLPIIWVHDFTEETASDFALSLQRLEENKQVQTIIVRIDSYGGEVYALLSMLEAMEECKKPIYTVCSGKAMSAAAVLLSAGDRRFIGKYSTVMIHQANGGTGGSNADVQSDAKELQRLQEIILTLLAKYCKTTKVALKQLIKENTGADIFLTPKQTVDLGVVDYIGIPKLKKVTRWEVDNGNDNQ